MNIEAIQEAFATFGASTLSRIPVYATKSAIALLQRIGSIPARRKTKDGEEIDLIEQLNVTPIDTSNGRIANAHLIPRRAIILISQGEQAPLARWCFTFPLGNTDSEQEERDPAPLLME